MSKHSFVLSSNENDSPEVKVVKRPRVPHGINEDNPPLKRYLTPNYSKRIDLGVAVSHLMPPTNRSPSKAVRPESVEQGEVQNMLATSIEKLKPQVVKFESRTNFMKKFVCCIYY